MWLSQILAARALKAGQVEVYAHKCAHIVCPASLPDHRHSEDPRISLFLLTAHLGPALKAFHAGMAPEPATGAGVQSWQGPLEP